MHMVDAGAARAFVQVVHILGDEQQLAREGALQPRQRSMRGKRTAMPLLWRVLRAMPSKPSSKTKVGLTLRTGPKLSMVVLRITASTRAMASDCISCAPPRPARSASW